MCLLFGPEQELRCNFPHLTDAAWRHLELFAEGRLDGVDDHNTRGEVFRGCENLLDAHLGIDLQIDGCNCHPAAAQLDLLRRLLARSVEDFRLCRKPRSNIQHERGLSYSRISAKKNQGAGYDAATQNAIELRDARWRAGSVGAGDLLKRDRRRIPRPCTIVGAWRSRSLFNERVPLLA